jgi:ABC-type nitrate/sulfonate/bicarbonate transport system permease component
MTPPRSAFAAASRWAHERRFERVISVCSPLLLLLVWELCARGRYIDIRFFPAPSAILAHLADLAASGSLWGDLGASLRRLAVGLLVGGIPGVVLGLAIGLYRPLRAAVDPLIAGTYPIPKSSLLPLVLLIFGFGEASKIVMVSIGVFYPVVINTAAGVAQIPVTYMDVARSFKAGPWNTFRYIAFPGALPLIMTGIRLGAGMGLVLIAIAEMIGAKSGLGYMIWNAWEVFDVEKMYAGLFVIAIIGFLLNLALDALERVVTPWRQRS